MCFKAKVCNIRGTWMFSNWREQQIKRGAIKDMARFESRRLSGKQTNVQEILWPFHIVLKWPMLYFPLQGEWHVTVLPRNIMISQNVRSICCLIKWQLRYSGTVSPSDPEYPALGLDSYFLVICNWSCDFCP